MNYFMLGKVRESGVDAVNAAGRRRWFYDLAEKNHLYSCWFDDNARHCLPEVFGNKYILMKFFFYDIMRHAEEAKKSHVDFGEHFSKNIRESTFIHYDRVKREILVSGSETYSRRTDGKPRYFPAVAIARRVKWFLSNSPFVESFKEVSYHNGLSSRFEIVFKAQVEPVLKSA